MLQIKLPGITIVLIESLNKDVIIHYLSIFYNEHYYQFAWYYEWCFCALAFCAWHNTAYWSGRQPTARANMSAQERAMYTVDSKAYYRASCVTSIVDNSRPLVEPAWTAGHPHNTQYTDSQSRHGNVGNYSGIANKLVFACHYSLLLFHSIF